MKFGLRTRPIFHGTSRRISSHMSLRVLALLLERIAERRAEDSRRNVLARLVAIKVLEYERGAARERQTTEVRPEAADMLRRLAISSPPRLHAIDPVQIA